MPLLPAGHGFNLSLFIQPMMITRAHGNPEDDNDLIGGTRDEISCSREQQS